MTHESYQPKKSPFELHEGLRHFQTLIAPDFAGQNLLTSQLPPDPDWETDIRPVLEKYFDEKWDQHERRIKSEHLRELTNRLRTHLIPSHVSPVCRAQILQSFRSSYVSPLPYYTTGYVPGVFGNNFTFSDTVDEDIASDGIYGKKAIIIEEDLLNKTFNSQVHALNSLPSLEALNEDFRLRSFSILLRREIKRKRQLLSAWRPSFVETYGKEPAVTIVSFPK